MGVGVTVTGRFASPARMALETSLALVTVNSWPPVAFVIAVASPDTDPGAPQTAS